ncbi:hypothetical protein [Methylobacterium gnaphalii]|uniref:Uncharacterized protein n=1 Tax=Methylobacterium gnaphalii TaxID=1010610 RepID=A0A512JIK0_9HYPH|nr:hypothetical protein [Methylobacterium gnaphalii]GEP09785.1 hypothetical protein MGN01_16300 [Methylobacterium gnaphalii]GJD67300.1 hypothetical protein MMMDOFMJ_0214 [Methylobacterium gnaphalii]GLS49815.1 hypothetical protein GCM10007885_26670 [Methylobacterium gnaphalii]
MGVAAEEITEADAIIDSYLVRADGNPAVALRLVVRDALADLCEVERRLNRKSRFVSRGYTRGSSAEQ